MVSFINSTSALSSQTYASSVFQSAGALDGRDAARLGTSRFVQNSNGSIHLIEKTPAEVVGERILRPLIDKISTLTSYVFSLIENLLLPLLPGAYAKEMRSLDANTMHFPSQEVLVSCLDKHPLTGKQVVPYLSEKGITKTLAESFANTDKAPAGVNLGVISTLYDLNEKLELPEYSLASLHVDLVGALKDCATRSKTAKESSTTYKHKSGL